jgi:MoaA/NifB/PqqE/SkfB family radical SAM enzyme
MNSKIKSPKIMNFDIYKQVIDDLQEFKNPVKTVRLYGFGEPLLNKAFPDMVAYAKKSDKVLNVDTTTNGSLLNPELNKQLINSGIDRINISIEGVNDKQYKEFTGKKINFNKLVKNIENLYKIKEKTIIFIKTNADYINEEDTEKFYEIFDPISDGCELEYSMNCWYDMENDYNKSLGIYGQPLLEKVQTCPYIFYSMMIHPDGQASLCFLDWNKKMIIGDTTENSVKEIWDSPILHSYRIGMLMDIKIDICRNCNQLKAGMPVNLDDHKEKILKRIKK